MGKKKRGRKGNYYWATMTDPLITSFSKYF